MSTGMENSKEFVDFKFKVNFTGDDDKPIMTEVDLGEKKEETKVIVPDIDIYEPSSVFVAPMYILHT